MNNTDTTKVWFFTGSGRGMGTHFAKAALNTGHKVVASGRNPDAVAKAIGEAEPPRRFIAGADAVRIAEQKTVVMKAQIAAYRNLSMSMAYDD